MDKKLKKYQSYARRCERAVSDLRRQLRYARERADADRARAERRKSLVRALYGGYAELGQQDFGAAVVKEWRERRRRESSLSQVSRLSMPAPSQASYTIGQPSEMDFSALESQWARGKSKRRNSATRSSWSNNLRRRSNGSKGRHGRSLGYRSGLASRAGYEIAESIESQSNYAYRGRQPDNTQAYLKAVKQART